MKHPLLLFIIIFIVFYFALTLSSCKKDDPTGPGDEDLCNYLSLSSDSLTISFSPCGYTLDANINSVNVNCSGGQGTYDMHFETIRDFSQRILFYEVTVNGSVCSFGTRPVFAQNDLTGRWVGIAGGLLLDLAVDALGNITGGKFSSVWNIDQNGNITGNGKCNLLDNTGFVSANTSWSLRMSPYKNKIIGELNIDNSYLGSISVVLFPISESSSPFWKTYNSSLPIIVLDAYFTDSNSGWAVGPSGIITHTSDGGKNWQIQPSGTSEVLRGVRFRDAYNGIVVGNNGIILKTVDGGDTWTPKESGVINRLNAIFFINETTGIIVGGSGTVLRTTDAGETWTDHTVSSAPTLNAVDFANTNDGIAVGQFGSIIHTNDGGLTWSDQSIFGDNLYSVSMPYPEVVVAVGGGFPSATIAITFNGGSTWNEVSTDSLGALYNVLLVDNGLGGFVGMAVGENGTILSTFDSGSTWLFQTSPLNSVFKEIFFTDNPSSNGIIVDEDGNTLRLEVQ